MSNSHQPSVDFKTATPIPCRRLGDPPVSTVQVPGGLSKDTVDRNAGTYFTGQPANGWKTWPYEASDPDTFPEDYSAFPGPPPYIYDHLNHDYRRPSQPVSTGCLANTPAEAKSPARTGDWEKDALAMLSGKPLFIPALTHHPVPSSWQRNPYFLYNGFKRDKRGRAEATSLLEWDEQVYGAPDAKERENWAAVLKEEKAKLKKTKRSNRHQAKESAASQTDNGETGMVKPL